MTTATSTSLGTIICQCSTYTLGYAEQLAADIPADRWNDHGMDGMNHPAFLYGHLAIYPNKVLAGFLGRADLVVPCPFDEAPLEQGQECLADAALYPTKDVVMPYFKERYETVLGILPDIAPEIFAMPNPLGGGFAERLPTCGAAVNFMMNNHIMMHAGQVSHWRRAIGLGSLSS